MMAAACSVSSSLQLPSIPSGGSTSSSSRKTPITSQLTRNCQCAPAAAVVRGQGPGAQLQCSTTTTTTLLERRNEFSSVVNRRGAIGLICGGVVPLSLLMMGAANAAGLPPEEKPRLCDAACEKELENVEMVTTESGLQYKDIKVGAGPSPPVGYQVAANYVAMVPSGQIFDSSLEKGQVYIFRVGSGQVIKGLDEGLLTMKIGGKRRLFIPGPLAFPKGLTSAPGRPRVAANSPVVFDVSLEYIPGLEVDEEE